MLLDDGADDRETQASSASLPRSRLAAEPVEGPATELRVHAWAMVRTLIADLAVPAPRVEHDITGPVPDRVVDQVAQRLFEPGAVGADEQRDRPSR